MGNQKNVIQTSSLTKKFGNFTAIDNLNLNIRKGEIYGLLGPNGAGKTTTIRLLCGLIKYGSGESFILGKKLQIKI